MRAAVRVGVAAVVLGWVYEARALPSYQDRLPNDAECSTCHETPAGGFAPGCGESNPCLNPFGERFAMGGRNWNAGLASEDTDGDGCTNGEEIGDADGDGVLDVADFCARSPGLGPGDPASCERNSDCCEPVLRERLRCECTDAPICMPPEPQEPPEPPRDPVDPPFAGQVFNDEFDAPISLLDGTWAPVANIWASRGRFPASCGTAVRDVWFIYEPDCEEGELRIELDGAGTVAVFADEGRSPGEELECTDDVTDLRVDVQRIYVRVSDGTPDAVRVTCIPPEDADDGSVCVAATPAGDEVVAVDLPYESVDTIRGDACPMGTGTDQWVEYTPTCTGTLRVELDLAEEMPAGPVACDAYGGGLRARLGVYGTCDDRGVPLSCVEACEGGASGVSEVPVIEGVPVFIRVGRLRNAVLMNRIHGQYDIECNEGPPPECDDVCAVGALCERDSESVQCGCRPGFIGDGVAAARGGSGCGPDPDYDHPGCASAGLECNGERCIGDSAGLRCECPPGFAWFDPVCLSFDPCAIESRGIPGPGYVECTEDRFHTACIADDAGWRCACEPGFTQVPDVERFECASYCGDAHRSRFEACDDGNVVNGDGCNDICQLEPLFLCTTAVGAVSLCEPSCGNGLIDGPGEECDDGNTADRDGCSGQCKLERRP